MRQFSIPCQMLALVCALGVSVSTVDARPSSSSGFSKSYQRPSSSYSYSASRVPSYTPPRVSAPAPVYRSPSYTAPRVSAPVPRQQTYSSSSTTVTNNHYYPQSTPYVHHSSSGGFGSSFLGGVAGAVVGNALTNHDRSTTYVQTPEPQRGPGYAPEGPDTFDGVQGPTEYTTASAQSSGSDFHLFLFFLTLFIVVAVAAIVASYIVKRLRKPSIHVARTESFVSRMEQRTVLFPENPDLLVGTQVTIPVNLAEDSGAYSFVLDKAGVVSSTALGKSGAYANLYLNDVLDEDFVQVFLGSARGGPASEATVYSNVQNLYGNEAKEYETVLSGSPPEVTCGGKTWRSCMVPQSMFFDSGPEQVVFKNNRTLNRDYTHYLFSRQTDLGAVEYLLIRSLTWIDPDDGAPCSALRFYAGVRISPQSIG